MANVFFIGDPHLDHRAIGKYRKGISDQFENTARFREEYEKRVKNRRDLVFFLGDVAFTEEALEMVAALPGRKILIKGNHDDMISTKRQAEVFEEIHGILKYKGLWLSHCPIHPAEMRRCAGNVHGHVHESTIMTGIGPFRKPHPKYLNACVDNIQKTHNKWLIDLNDVRSYFGILK